MNMSTKNLTIILCVIGAIFIAYFGYQQFFANNSTTTTPLNSALVSSNVSVNSNTPSVATPDDFLSFLLSVKSIKLNDQILSDSVFSNLHDSTIDLLPDGDQGRPNPFAVYGPNNSNISPSISNTPSVTSNPADLIPILNPLPKQ